MRAAFCCSFCPLFNPTAAEDRLVQLMRNWLKAPLVHGGYSILVFVVDVEGRKIARELLAVTYSPALIEVVSAAFALTTGQDEDGRRATRRRR